MKTLLAGFKVWALDAGQRCVKAFVTAFTAIMLAGGVIGVNGAESMSVLASAGTAGLGAAASVLLSLLAKWSGDPTTASFKS